MKTEITIRPSSGFLMLLVTLALLGAAAFCFATKTSIALGVILLLLGSFALGGFMIINPNESTVLVLFGKYVDRKSVV